MTEIDTDKGSETIVKKEISFWNRSSTRLLSLLTFIVVPILIYSFWWVPRQECVSKISYRPAGTDMSIAQLSTNTEGYYSYKGRKFKERNEAVSYCLSEG